MRLLRHPTRFPEERDGAWSRRRASAFSRHFRCRFSVRRACSPPVRPPARPPRSRSLVSKGKTHAAHGHGPAAHSLAWAPQAAGTAIALSSAPAAAIYCHTPRPLSLIYVRFSSAILLLSPSSPLFRLESKCTSKKYNYNLQSPPARLPGQRFVSPD